MSYRPHRKSRRTKRIVLLILGMILVVTIIVLCYFILNKNNSIENLSSEISTLTKDKAEQQEKIDKLESEVQELNDKISSLAINETNSSPSTKPLSTPTIPSLYDICGKTPTLTSGSNETWKKESDTFLACANLYFKKYTPGL